MAAESSTSEPSADSYVGSLISLVSKHGVRYEGIMHHLNPAERTICLRNVRLFGTEGRKKDGPQVFPSNEVYDFITFRASEIEDLLVKFLPPVQTGPIQDEPTIMQSHYSLMGLASTPWSGTISDSSSQAVQLGHPRSTFQGGLPLYNTGKNIESSGSAPPVTICSGFGTPTYYQGFHAPMGGLPHLPRAPLVHTPPGFSIPHSLPQQAQAPLVHTPPGFSIPHSLPQHAQYSTVNSLFPSGTISLQEAASRLPPLLRSTSTLVPASVQHPNYYSLFPSTPIFPQVISPLPPPASCLPSLMSSSLRAIVAPTQASLLAAEPSVNLLPNRYLVSSHTTSFSGLDISSMPQLGYINSRGMSVQEINTAIRSGQSNESAPSFPFETISRSMPSSSRFFSSIQGETSSPLVTPGQLQHPSYFMLPSSLPVQTVHEDAKIEAQELKTESESAPLNYERLPSATSMQKPLVPVPKHPSYSLLSSSLPVQAVHEDAKFKAQEPKIKLESEPLPHELPPLLALPSLAQSRFSEPVIKFTEDFDFVAMNKKFNKDEVWGHLGKGKSLAEYDKREQSSNVIAIQEEDDKSLKLETQPAYSKDDSDKFSHKPDSGRARVSEQLKADKAISGDSSRRRSNKKGGSGGRRHGPKYRKRQ